MEDKKVKVISTVANEVVVNNPNLALRRTWNGVGSMVMMDKHILEELMYQTGFRYMIEEGILYIDDMEVKKELGIEPEDATAPVNIVLLTETDLKNYLTVMPTAVFKEKVAKLPSEQLMKMCDYAIANKLTDYTKCEILKKLCGRDILKSVELENK